MATGDVPLASWIPDETGYFYPLYLENKANDHVRATTTQSCFENGAMT